MISNSYCIIMGGGVGSRFWPMSREHKPKQFLDIFGTGRSLLRMTYDRFARIIPQDHILVVTNEMYKMQVLEQIPEMNENQVLLEPMRRNTAPCIAYACYHILAQDPTANIVVSPSDHLILDEERFLNNVRQSLDYVAIHDELVTLGVRPSRPDTGYGYIQMDTDTSKTKGNFVQVKTFTEKPNLEMAKMLVDSGEFLWNSGMFVWNIRTIMTAFRTFLPELCELLETNQSAFATPQEHEYIQAIFPRCQSISIDYGVMEKASNVAVLPVDFGWADLGTWGAVYDLKEKDEHKNVALSTETLFYEASGNLVSMDNPNGLVVVQGLNDYIITQSDGVLLICERSQEQRIKQMMADASTKFDQKFD